mmetsp:Transcript_95339/g.169271  ORF Transcript_95339/g.169271 Transcript_95339/m.169271 type:complete len:223 (-) Transcript_95339:601-1269(-)
MAPSDGFAVGIPAVVMSCHNAASPRHGFPPRSSVGRKSFTFSRICAGAMDAAAAAVLPDSRKPSTKPGLSRATLKVARRLIDLRAAGCASPSCFSCAFSVSFGGTSCRRTEHFRARSLRDGLMEGSEPTLVRWAIASLGLRGPGLKSRDVSAVFEGLGLSSSFIRASKSCFRRTSISCSRPDWCCRISSACANFSACSSLSCSSCALARSRSALILLSTAAS